MSQILEDLIFGILLLLPVKSLLRFRAVSKDIRTLIDSSDFINSHLCKSSQNLNLLKLISSDRSRNKFHVCDVNLDMEREILRSGKSISSQLLKVYGYCKGLILLNGSDHKFGLTLWNPSTRKYKDLPCCPLFGDDGVEVLGRNGSGLVYVDYTDEYKAFIIFRMRSCEDQVWVYELKSNIWRRIQCNIVPPSYLGVGCFTDGNLHWLCKHDYKLTRQIVTFDIRKETFCFSPQPVCSINSIYRVSAELIDLEGCLSISYILNVGYFEADLYMRKKKDGVYDDQFTWIQLYSLRQPVLPVNFIHMFLPGTMKVLGYLKRGDDDKDKILIHLGEDCIVSYDLIKKTFGKVEIENKDTIWDAPFFCIESLVQVASDSGASLMSRF